MLLFVFLLSLPLFPHFSYSRKHFLVELKSGKNKIIETNNGTGTGTGENGNGNGTETQQKNEEGKKQNRPKKVEHGNESHLTRMKTTSENHLPTTDNKSQGDDYFLGGILCFVFQFCKPTKPNRPTKPNKPNKPNRPNKPTSTMDWFGVGPGMEYGVPEYGN